MTKWYSKYSAELQYLLKESNFFFLYEPVDLLELVTEARQGSHMDGVPPQTPFHFLPTPYQPRPQADIVKSAVTRILIECLMNIGSPSRRDANCLSLPETWVSPDSFCLFYCRTPSLV